MADTTKLPARPGCVMNGCYLTGRCLYPDTCDDRGFITKSRDLSFEQRVEMQDRLLQEQEGGT